MGNSFRAARASPPWRASLRNHHPREREREGGSVRKNFYVVSLISAELVRIKWNWTEFIGSIDNTRFSFFEGEYGRNGRRYFFFEKTSTTTTPSPAGRWSDAHPCRGREARSGVVLRDRYTCLSLSLCLERAVCTCSDQFFLHRSSRVSIRLQGDELTTGNRDSYFYY